MKPQNINHKKASILKDVTAVDFGNQLLNPSANKDISTKKYLCKDTPLTFMKFAEAAILLREIADRCPGLEGCTITLIPQKAMYPHYQGYHINIKGNLSRESQGGLRKIVEGHDLMLQIKTDCVIVYESRPT